MAKTYRHETKWTTKNQVARSFYGYPDKPTAICLHHWGADGQKFDDVAHFLSTNTVPTSAHTVLEDGRIATLAVPEVATFHAGSTQGNGMAIGVELRPERTKGDEDTLVQYVYELETVYGSLNIYQHKDFSATACAGRWGAFIPELISRVNAMHANGGKDPGLSVAKPVVKPESNKTEPVKKPVAKKSAPETLTYKNQSVNGNDDVYALITETRKLARENNELLKKLLEETGK